MLTFGNLLILVVGFLATVAFGFWLGITGRPYNGVLFNIHKLIALGTAIITSIRLYDVFENSEMQILVVAVIVVAGLALVTLFASGAFLSIGNLRYEVMKFIHNAALVVMVLAMSITIFLLRGKL